MAKSKDLKAGGDDSLFSYDQLFSHTKIGVYRNTPGRKGHFIQANDSLVRMFEAKSKKDFLRHNVSDLYRNPADRAVFVAKIMKKGFVEGEKLALRTLKGRDIIGAVTAVRKKDRDGNIYFDGIIEDITDRIESEKFVRESSAKWRDLFNIMPVGATIVDSENRVLDANPALGKILRLSGKEIASGHYKKRKYLRSDGTEMPPEEFPSNRALKENKAIRDTEIGIVTEKGETIWTSVSSVPMRFKPGHSVTVTTDITKSKKSEEKIRRLSNLYKALSGCNQAIMRSKSENELFRKICLDMVRYGDMKMAWIGLTDPKTGLIRPVAASGDGSKYLRDIRISVSDKTKFGLGPTGTAVREARPFWCQDFQNDPATRPWRKQSLSFGWKSSASLPIFKGGSAIGALTLYSDNVNRFDAAAKQLLIEVASDIGYALDNFAAEVRRVTAEKNLENSEARYRRLIETEPECVKLVSKDNILLDMNAAGLAMVEADSLEQVVGKPLKGLVDPEYWKVFSDVTRKVFAGREASAQFKITGLKGGKRWLETHAVPLLDESGKIYSLLAVTKDITDKKKNEEALSGRVDELEKLKKSLINLVEELDEKEREVETEKVKYATLLENISDGLIAVDLNGKVIYANEEVARLIGMSMKKISSLEAVNYFELSDLKDFDTNLPIPHSEQPISKVLSGKSQKFRKKYYMIRKDGKEFPVVIAASPIIVDGKLIGANAIFRDITQEAEVDRVKNEFVSVASHQLRTPLSSIKWLIEALLSEKNLSEKTLAKLKNIFISNERLITLVNDLLKISKIESGNVSGERELFDIAGSVRSIVKDYKAIAGKSGKKIILTMPEKNQKIYGFQTLFEEALNNVLANAIIYGKENSEVAVKMEQVNGDYRIAVNNKDHFISKEDSSKIFTKFFRSESARLIKPEGSGLGLYIAKFGVEKNGGRIWFESNAKDGTTFYFTIPISGNHI